MNMKIFSFYFFLLSLNSSFANEPIIHLSTDVKDQVLIFELENKSKINIGLQKGDFHRSNINLLISYGSGIRVEELFIPEHPAYEKIQLQSKKSIEFVVDLSRRFPKIEKLIKKKCLFLYWGLVIRVDEKRGTKAWSGSKILNKDFCVNKK